MTDETAEAMTTAPSRTTPATVRTARRLRAACPADPPPRPAGSPSRWRRVLPAPAGPGRATCARVGELRPVPFGPASRQVHRHTSRTTRRPPDRVTRSPVNRSRPGIRRWRPSSNTSGRSSSDSMTATTIGISRARAKYSAAPVTTSAVTTHAVRSRARARERFGVAVASGSVAAFGARRVHGRWNASFVPRRSG